MQPLKNMSYKYKQKIPVFLVGTFDVGKTCIINYYLTKEYKTFFPSTLGIDCHKIDLGNGILQILDTQGKERYRGVVLKYIIRAKVIIFVYDPSYRQSFEKLKSHMKDVKQISKNAFFIIVQNKNDIFNKEVPVSEGEYYAASIGCPFFCVSAATGEGIEELFQFVSQNNTPFSLVINKIKAKKKKHLCIFNIQLKKE